ncbi:MAG: ClpP family protease, partial [Dermabacteraceae bacterium]
DLILSMKRTLAELIAEQTDKSLEQITEDSDRDKWFTATEALEYGFIDQIISGSGDVTGGGGTDE